MIVLAASLALLVVLARGVDRLVATAGESRACRATRVLLWAVAAVVIVEAALGALGVLTPAATLAVLAALAAAVVSVARRQPRLAEKPRDPLSRAEVALCAALVAIVAARLWAGVHKTTFLYDTLSYHLHVPATWMHERRITIVPAVFGDPSPAYAPANLELVFLFLMAPLRSDYLAAVGQLPFGVLAAAAIAATVREAGGRRDAALAGAVAFLLIPEIWGQMPTAMTDLGLAACWLTAMPFALRLWRGRQPRRADLLTFAVAIGLTSGSKYAGAALALPLAAMVAIALARDFRQVEIRAVAPALAAALGTGGFWYVRNVVVTGNPLYPVAFPGLPLPALYGGAEMRAWDYHLARTDVAALASMLTAAGVGFISAAAVATARLWRRAETILLVAVLATFWLAIPYQESRFLFAAFGVAAALIALAVDRPPAVVGWCGLGVAVIGSLLEWPTNDRLLLLPIAAFAAVAGARGNAFLRRLGPRAPRVLVGVAAVALLVSLGAGAANYARRDPGYAVGEDLEVAWTWFRAHVHDAQVGYTGNNLAFPLAGEWLSNRVRYVNVAGAPGDRLHDFGPPGDGTPEPAPYRRGASADAWLANVRAAGTQVLFVAALDPGVRRTVDADGDGFPVERVWADARPHLFSLLYSSAGARIYAVTLR
jgi:hypothetical protein